MKMPFKIIRSHHPHTNTHKHTHTSTVVVQSTYLNDNPTPPDSNKFSSFHQLKTKINVLILISRRWKGWRRLPSVLQLFQHGNQEIHSHEDQACVQGEARSRHPESTREGQKFMSIRQILGEVRFDHFISRDTMNGSQGRHEIQTVFGVLRRSVEALDTECSKLKSSVDGTAGTCTFTSVANCLSFFCLFFLKSNLAGIERERTRLFEPHAVPPILRTFATYRHV